MRDPTPAVSSSDTAIGKGQVPPYSPEPWDPRSVAPLPRPLPHSPGSQSGSPGHKATLPGSSWGGLPGGMGTILHYGPEARNTHHPGPETSPMVALAKGLHGHTQAEVPEGYLGMYR